MCVRNANYGNKSDNCKDKKIYLWTVMFRELSVIIFAI